MFLLFYLIHNNRRTRSKPHDFHIPDNIDEFGKSNTNRKSSSTSTISDNFEGNFIHKLLYSSSALQKLQDRSDGLMHNDNIYLLTKFNELQINSANDTQNNFIKDETIQQQIKNYHIDINDEDEICNNPYFHSEEQDEFEIPDDI
ncbi:unnamed protein product [Rhizophagus irregularis]|nr:unnamed protein product [Rhizophagus irregularis]